MSRTLIAGFGNVLRGDDGFGVQVVQRLEALGWRGRDVELMDVGTGGIRLAQELLASYARLIIVDAVTRGATPGSVHVLKVESVDAIEVVDLHLAVPSRALSVAKALGALPEQVYLVGCEPAEVDELTMELSPSVEAAVDVAIEQIQRLMEQAAVFDSPALPEASNG